MQDTVNRILDTVNRIQDAGIRLLAKNTIFSILYPIFYILFSTFYFLVSVSTVSAQSVTLSIDPPVVEALLTPNKSFIQSFTLQATGSDLVAVPTIHLVKPEGISGHVTVDSTPVDPSHIPLTVVSLTHPLGVPFDIVGGEARFDLQFEAASSDISEDVYLALVVKVGPGESFDKSSTTYPAISALILTTITPSGVLPINLEISGFDLPVIHDSWHTLSFSPELSNSTPIMIRPTGKFDIISPTGSTKSSLDLFPSLILGNSSRRLQSMTHDLPTSLSWKPSWSNIGPYRFNLLITTSGGTKLSQVEKVVWILPIRLIIITILLLIIFYRLTWNKQITKVKSYHEKN